MKKFTSIEIVAILIAVATYLMVGPSIAYFSSEVFSRFSGKDFSFLSLVGLLPLIAVFFVYRYGYKKQMELLSSNNFKNFLEKKRKNILDKSVFLFDTKENVEKKYYPDAEKFAQSLIPVSIIIVVVCFFMTSRSYFNFSLSNIRDFETINFYLGLILVIINFYPRNSSKQLAGSSSI